MLWPLVAAASAVGSLYVTPSPRPLLAMGAAALVAFLFLSPPRPPASVAVPVCATAVGPLSAGYPEICRIVGRLKFARAYSAADVDGVGHSLERFLVVFHRARSQPSHARLQALEMARDALVRDVLSLTYSVPPSCRDRTIVDAARAAHRFTSACIEQVRTGMGLAPDTAPEPIAFDAGAAVA
jgi:hypothetical protein